MNEREKAERLARDLGQRLSHEPAYAGQTAPDNEPLLQLADDLLARAPFAPTPVEKARLRRCFDQVKASRGSTMPHKPWLPGILRSVTQSALWAALLLGVLAVSVILISNLLGKPAIPAGGAAPATKSTTNTPAPTRTFTPPPAPTSTPGPITINFYFSETYSYTKEITALSMLVDRFNAAHPGMVIRLSTTYSSASGDDYFTGLAKQFDCFQVQVDPYNAAASGAILGLNALVDGEDAAFRNDYDPRLFAASRSAGELYVLPLTRHPAIMVYNADLLARRGLQSPSNDWTFDDFVRQVTAAASTAKDDQTYGFLPASHMVDTFELFLSGYHAQWLNHTGNLPAAKYETPEMRVALTRLAYLYQTGAIFQDTSGGDGWRAMVDAIAAGKVAYWTTIAGEEDLEFFDPGYTPDFKIGIAPLPVMPSANNRLIAGSYERGLYISSQSKNPRACWTWMKFLAEQAVTLNGIPARQSAAASPEWEANAGTANAAVYRLALERTGRTNASIRDNYLTLPFTSWLWQAQAAAQKGKDPQQALAEAQRKADDYHACLLAGNIVEIQDRDLYAKVTECAKRADPGWQ